MLCCVALLDTRGRRDKALHALEFICNHRVLIYMRPPQDPQKRFFATVQFDDILQI